MKTVLQKILSFSLILALLGTGMMPSLHALPLQPNSISSTERDEAKEKEDYPILQEYLRSKYHRVQADDSKLIRAIVSFEPGNYSALKDRILSLPDTKLHYEYSTLFEGISLDIKQKDLAKVRAIPGVKTVEKSDRLIPQMMNAKELTEVIEAKALYADDVNLDGRGMVIATIDTGVDMHHPDMRIDDDAKAEMKIKGAQFPFTDKIPFAYSYFDDSNDRVHDNVAKPHGMHIAGILAGNSPNPDGFKGIAPNAQLLAYKVITYDRKGPDADPNEIEYIGEDAQYNAMEDAVRRGADIISLSIGAFGSGRSDDLWQSVLQKAHEKGVVVVAAMGNWSASSTTSTYDNFADANSDRQDISTTVSVAANSLAIGVGSTRNVKVDLGRVQIGALEFAYSDIAKYNNHPVPKDDISRKYAGRKTLPDEVLNKEFIFVKRGMNEDDLSADRVRDKIVVAWRGGEAVKDKAIRFLEKGAAGFILINAVTGISRGDYYTHPLLGVEHLTIPQGWAVSISGKDGEVLLKELEKNPQQTIHFNPVHRSIRLLDETGISGFSSFGPNYDLELKPDIVAPGENIISTGNGQSYVTMSGTSMAAPHVAGLSTLLLQRLKQMRHPFLKQKNPADLVKVMMMNSAEILYDRDGLQPGEEALPYLPRRQGAGQANLRKALQNEVLVTYNDKGAASLKEIGADTTFTLKLENMGDVEQEFTIEPTAVLTQTLVSRQLNGEEGPVSGQTIHSKVIPGSSIDLPPYVRVAPRGTAYVKVHLQAGQVEDAFVEGFIRFIPKNEGQQPALVMPYLGFKGNWGKEPILDAPQWESTSLTKLSVLRKFVKEDDHTRTVEFTALGSKNPETGMDDPTTYTLNSERLGIFGPTVTKKVAPVLIFLREAYLYDVAIVQEKAIDAKPLRVINTAHYPEKYIEDKYLEYGEKYQEEIRNGNVEAIWDGGIYNPTKTGSWESSFTDAAPEGQYYYRVRAKKTPKDDWQVIYYPIRVDNTKPTLDATVDRANDRVLLRAADNEGLEYIGATVNRKPVHLHKVDADTYSLSIPKDELTKGNLSVEAMDYAGNPVSLKMNLHEKAYQITNLPDVEQQKTKTLTLQLKPETKLLSLKVGEAGLEKELPIVTSQSATAGQQVVAVDLSSLPVGTHRLLLTYSTLTEEKLEEEISLQIGRTLPRLQPRPGHTGDEDEDLTDENLDGEGGEVNTGESSSVFHMSDDIEMINGHFLNYGIASKHKAVELTDQGDIFYKVLVWLRSGQEAWISVTNTHYNSITAGKENFEHLEEIQKITGPSGDDFEEVFVPIKNGDNYIKIKVFDTNGEPTDQEKQLNYPGRLLFNNKYTVFLDAKAPTVEFGSNVAFSDDDEDSDIPGNTRTGKIYVSGTKGHIEGKASDDLDKWSIKINGDLIERGGLLGHFGEKENIKTFSYAFEAKDGEYVSVICEDFSGNQRNFSLKIVQDNQKPVITILPNNPASTSSPAAATAFRRATTNDSAAPTAAETGLTPDSILHYEFSDDINTLDELVTLVSVNGQIYRGDAIRNYEVAGHEGKYLIRLVATDMAGNRSEKEIRLGDVVADFPDQPFKKEAFVLAELDNINNLIEPVEGITVKILHQTKDVDKDGNIELLLSFRDALGNEKQELRKVKIIPQSELIEDAALDHELKKPRYRISELNTFSDLFTLRPDVSYTIDEKVDADKLVDGHLEVPVTFYRANHFYTHRYRIEILPELTAKLRANSFYLDQLGDVKNLVDASSLDVSFVEAPKAAEGEQKFKVLVRDVEGNTKEFEFTILVKARPKASFFPHPLPQFTETRDESAELLRADIVKPAAATSAVGKDAIPKTGEQPSASWPYVILPLLGLLLWSGKREALKQKEE